jgi:hypothetical protein
MKGKNQNRRLPNRRPDQGGEPRFCARCGGALAMQNANQTNVCRCKKS